MTAFDRLADHVVQLARGADRLATLQRRHDRLSAGFRRLDEEMAARHRRGQAEPSAIAHLMRLDRAARRVDEQMLALVEELSGVVRQGAAHGD